MSDAKKPMTIEDFIARLMTPTSKRDQFIDGRIVPKAKPGGDHGEAEFTLVQILGVHFRKKKRDDGSGGWWLKTETTILYPTANHMITHDLVGWRRDRVPQSPTGYPVRERPDWACEIAVSSLKWDTRDMPRILEGEGVPHYWVLDPINGHLRVYETHDGVLRETMSLFREDGPQRLPPFEAVAMSVGQLLGDEDEDDV